MRRIPESQNVVAILPQFVIVLLICAADGPWARHLDPGCSLRQRESFACRSREKYRYLLEILLKSIDLERQVSWEQPRVKNN